MTSSNHDSPATDLHGMPELHPWLGHFADPELEAEFKRTTLLSMRRSTVGATIVAGVVFVVIGLLIDLTRGPGTSLPTWIPWLRGGWALIAVFLILGGRRSSDARSVELSLFAVFSSILVVYSVIAYEYGITFEHTDRRFYFAVIAGMAMMLPPWSLKWGVGIVALEVVLVMAIEIGVGFNAGTTAGALALLFATGGLGYVIAYRLQLGRRQEFILLRRERAGKQELAQANRELEAQLLHSQKMELVGQLASGVAHDFNNVLQAIFGHVEFAKQAAPEGSEQREDLDEIGSAADRGAQLVRQLLAMGRRSLVRRKEVSLNEVSTALLKMLRRLLHRNVKLEFDEGLELPLISADPGQIEQILLNLVVNARDAMPEGGVIRISTGTENKGGDDEKVLLRVSDQGTGMSEETRAQIFDPFFSTKPAGQGTGLGLATVRSIVDAHGGTIEVQSVLGKGTTFTIRFPSIEHSASVSISSSFELPELGNGEVLLVVDDEPVVLGVAARILRQADYEVIEASDGMQAITAFEKHKGRIDAVITDVDMPAASGHDVYEAIRRTDRNRPVLFTSAFPSGIIGEEILRDPAADFVTKPYRGEDLLRRTRRLLDARAVAAVHASGGARDR